MSQEHVNAAWRAVDAFNRGDDDALVALAHPHVQWEAGLLGTPTYRGREGIRKMLRDVRVAWTNMRLEVVGAPIGVGAAVVTEVRFRARGHRTGIPVEAIQFYAAEFRGGRAVRGGAFASKPEALEAMGLPKSVPRG